MLRVLGDFVFCCDALVTGVSALASVAALATHARVYAAHPTNVHFGFAVRKVACGTRKQASLSDAECLARSNTSSAARNRVGSEG